MFHRLAVSLFCCLLFFSFSCTKRHHTVSRSCYFWKTNYGLSPYETKRLKGLQVQNIYLRFFDVEWDENANRPKPIAIINITRPDTSFQYIPVVFITQRTLTFLHDSDLMPLSKNINNYITYICHSANINPKEIQIDCDWTAGTKDIYFKLLRSIKQQTVFAGKTISCTIRLHQVKYISSGGIPPVDKGMLMCYSMGNIKNTGPVNSILDADDAKKYLRNINKYPLPLDIALPLYDWCVLFRNNKYAGILHDVQPEAIQHNALFLHENNNLYRCTANAMLQGYNLKKDDIIRIEIPTQEDMATIADYTANHVANDTLYVAFFACDSITLNKYSNDELEAVYNNYR